MDTSLVSVPHASTRAYGLFIDALAVARRVRRGAPRAAASAGVVASLAGGCGDRDRHIAFTWPCGALVGQTAATGRIEAALATVFALDWLASQ
jgi:hypothetical protein